MTLTRGDTTRNLDEALKWALAYSQQGWAVVPLHRVTKAGRCTCGSPTCHSPAKHPRIEWNETQTERPTTTEIRGWWRQWPGTNVGVVTGLISNLVVIDVDGPEGEASLRAAGIDIESLPDDAIVDTGRGFHIYVNHPGHFMPNKVGVLPKVDVRAEKGMVVAPPSVHASGTVYTSRSGGVPVPIDHPQLLAIAEGPTRRNERAKAVPRGTAGAWDWLVGDLGIEVPVAEGARNDTLARVAGRLLGQDRPVEEVLALVRSFNADALEPPLDDDEVATIVGSIATRDGNASLARLNQRLRLRDPIVRVLRQGDRWLWVLESGKTFEVAATSGALLTFGKVRTAVFRETGQVLATPIKGSGGWERTAELMAGVAEVSDDADLQDDVIEWLRTVCESGWGFKSGLTAYDLADIEQRWAHAYMLKRGYPVATTDGRLSIRLSKKVRGEAVANRAMPIKTSRELAEHLRVLGFTDGRVNVAWSEAPRDIGRRQEARVWTSPPGFVSSPLGLDTIPYGRDRVENLERALRAESDYAAK
ncbi:MAG: bifunctional DNA primase/polymerase [Dehalococcoidia bacterium]|nr:bifunctional DNA primase/polymerase [Dehalococcoidia bacterium]